MCPPEEQEVPFHDEEHLPAARFEGWRQSEEIALIRASSYSLYARLRSIEWDARRVLTLCADISPNLPLFANARTGTWYVPPPCILKISSTNLSTGSHVCCFKSSDGHYGQWTASVRRPNLRLLQTASEAGGAIIVDATRSGKSWPDALTKTFPIWCAVVNAVAGFISESCSATQLYLHPSISASEKNSILKLLPTWVSSWKDSGIDLRALVPGFAAAGLPVRPLWVRADVERVWENGIPSAKELGFIPIVCISASPPLLAGERSYIEADQENITDVVGNIHFPRRITGFNYVQGAGDDCDNWSNGLTPVLFWHFRNAFLEYASTHQSVAAHDSVVRDGLIKLIDKIGDIRERAQADIGCDSDAMSLSCRCGINSSGNVDDEFSSKSIFSLLGSRVTVCASTPRAIVADVQKIVDRSDRLVFALSHSQKEKMEESLQSCAMCETESRACSCFLVKDEGTENRSVSKRLQWFSMSNYRGKPDYKHGLCRVLGQCLTLLRDGLLQGNTEYSTSCPTSAVLICDSGDGDWACGLAIAWIAWHCNRECNLESSEKDHVSKRDVQAAMLRVLAERPDLRVTRHTLQQINRFFQSPDPSSRIL